MSSSLRVNTIVPSTGTNVAIGTANGTVTFTDSVNFVLGTGSSIFSPASNTLTFGTNDAERIRITNTGRIGINQTSPEAMLQVDYDYANSEVGLRLRAASGSGTKTWQLSEINGNAGVFTIRNATNSQDILNIDGVNQRVGVNETAPAADLVVKQSGNTFTTQSQTVALFQRSSTTGHGAKIAIVAGNAASSDINLGDTDDEDIGKIQYYHTDNSLRFTTNTAERLRITDTGMVGINMTPNAVGSSTYMLQMYNAGSQCFMSIGQGSGNGPLNGLVVGVSNAAHYVTGRENRPMIFGTNDTERIRITNDGDVGIGEDSPADRLVVQETNASGDVAVRIKNDTLTDGSASTPTTASLYLNTSTGDFNTFYIQARRYDNDTHFGYSNPRDGSHTPNMIISNEGRITMPSQPCAMAYNAQGQHMAGAAVAQFNSTRFNIGNMYNSSNGRMTVPVDGRYLVAYSGLHDYSSQSSIGFDIRINGSNFNGGEGYQARNGTPISTSQLSKTLILSLSANDYLDIYIRTSGTQVHQRYGSFSVCLIT